MVIIPIIVVLYGYIWLYDGIYIYNMYIYIYIYLLGGFNLPPLKNDGVKVSWNDYPIYELEKKIHVPNHQRRLTMSGDVLEIPRFF